MMIAIFGDSNSNDDGDDYGNDVSGSSRMIHPSIQHRRYEGGDGWHDIKLENDHWEPPSEDDAWWEPGLAGSSSLTQMLEGDLTSSFWDPDAGAEEVTTAAALRRWSEFCKLGVQRSMNHFYKLVTTQRHPYLSAILTVLLVLVIHYRADLKQFWIFHRDPNESVVRTLTNVAETLLEIVRGAYAACVLSPIQQAAQLWRQFVHNLFHIRAWITTWISPEPMPDLIPDDDVDANGNKKDDETKKKTKGTKPFEGRWDDPDFLEPAFLTPEEYPLDWKVYHPDLGVVLKTEAEEYDQLWEKIKEQEEQLRLDGIIDDDHRPLIEGLLGSLDGRTPEAAVGAAAPSETSGSRIQEENASRDYAGFGYDDKAHPNDAGDEQDERHEEGKPSET